MKDSLKEIISRTRTFRRFDQERPINTDTLKDLIELARLSGSAQNLQPLKYKIITEREAVAAVFPHLGWAGYLTGWPGPKEGERPSAYIICLLDTDITAHGDFDLGIASQNILLGATALGIGGCRIGSFSKKLSSILALPASLKIILVLALGFPVEQVSLTEAETGGSIKYWRDPQGTHFVPKRKLADIII